MNYVIIGLVVVAVIMLIVWLVRQNRKDEENFEQTVNASELNPDKHKEDGI